MRACWREIPASAIRISPNGIWIEGPQVATQAGAVHLRTRGGAYARLAGPFIDLNP